jgi:hypothetical protein
MVGGRGGGVAAAARGKAWAFGKGRFDRGG